MISISDAPSPRPRIFSEWDILRPTMEQKAGSLSHHFGSYAVSSVAFSAEGGWRGGGGGRRGRGGGDCGRTCMSFSVSSLNVSCYCGGHWSVGVQLRFGVLARMEGDLSHRVDLGVAWRGEGDG